MADFRNTLARGNGPQKAGILVHGAQWISCLSHSLALVMNKTCESNYFENGPFWKFQLAKSISCEHEETQLFPWWRVWHANNMLQTSNNKDTCQNNKVTCQNSFTKIIHLHFPCHEERWQIFKIMIREHSPKQASSKIAFIYILSRQKYCLKPWHLVW